MKEDQQRHCFVICPIGDRGSDVRKRSDGILNEIIRPAVESMGFHVERADHDRSPGIVTDSIIQKTMDSDLVVADLSGYNPNVMYELAVRHASGRPVVQMIEHGQVLPFDVSAVNTIVFEANLGGRSAAVAAVQAAASAALEGRHANPIRRAAELHALRSSDDRQGELVADALSELRQLAGEIRAAASAPAQSMMDTLQKMDLAKRVERSFSEGLQIHGYEIVDIRLRPGPHGFEVRGRTSDGSEFLSAVPFTEPPVTVPWAEANLRKAVTAALQGVIGDIDSDRRFYAQRKSAKRERDESIG